MKNKQHKPIIALDKNSNKAFDFLIDENGKYTHNSKELDFKIETTPDGFTAMTVNGLTYPVEVIAQHQNEYELLVNGVSYVF